MNQHDHLIITKQAEIHRQALLDQAENDRLAAELSQDDPAWHQQLLSKLGDALIAGGEQLKSAAQTREALAREHVTV